MDIICPPPPTSPLCSTTERVVGGLLVLKDLKCFQERLESSHRQVSIEDFTQVASIFGEVRLEITEAENLK